MGSPSADDAATHPAGPTVRSAPVAPAALIAPVAPIALAVPVAPVGVQPPAAPSGPAAVQNDGLPHGTPYERNRLKLPELETALVFAVESGAPATGTNASHKPRGLQTIRPAISKPSHFPISFGASTSSFSERVIVGLDSTLALPMVQTVERFPAPINMTEQAALFLVSELCSRVYLYRLVSMLVKYDGHQLRRVGPSAQTTESLATATLAQVSTKAACPNEIKIHRSCTGMVVQEHGYSSNFHHLHHQRLEINLGIGISSLGWDEKEELYQIESL
ncbi:hypothetical protein BJ166DRAFT_628217 [Pestalotiopsis sp. NC0098]|nr:hypothetical protein BJ166DRAFT_628217 [Pestalotiopsis sp. NC0098]